MLLKKKRLTDSENVLEDTKVQLEANEEFCMETESACREKAADWLDGSEATA